MPSGLFGEDIMLKNYGARHLGVLLFAALSLPLCATARFQEKPHQRNEKREEERLMKEVRHRLVLLPYYSVFDNLQYKVEGDKVTLLGQVVRPTLKSDAETAVKSIEGVATVDNQIEVLPLAPNDDRIRRAVFRAIYFDSALSRYGMEAVPSIHIIVKNGNVTLEGVVDSETDKNLAGLRANGVPNVFSVKNNLSVAK
jgi:osmotically-inducible protein OsmY